MAPNQETKIVIVAGQEFSVPFATETEAIRQQLVSMGFADVAGAMVKTGEKTVGEETVTTLEFVKAAGTKGLTGGALAAVLDQVRARRTAGPDASTDARLLADLTTEALTVAQCLTPEGDIRPELVDALRDACDGDQPTTRQEGVQLCARIDRLSPDATAAVRCAW